MYRLQHGGVAKYEKLQYLSKLLCIVEHLFSGQLEVFVSCSTCLWNVLESFVRKFYTSCEPPALALRRRATCEGTFTRHTCPKKGLRHADSRRQIYACFHTFLGGRTPLESRRVGSLERGRSRVGKKRTATPYRVYTTLFDTI